MRTPPSAVHEGPPWQEQIRYPGMGSRQSNNFRLAFILSFVGEEAIRAEGRYGKTGKLVGFELMMFNSQRINFLKKEKKKPQLFL